ncbi:MAG: hypothetical protein HRU27_09770 [Rhizobiaceae bacterium]|nr:hypothetical protein [Hyphomicrobiales bacterium]NRB30869.1 hypothetical protein [Rhizobiaceae bacterium]
MTQSKQWVRQTFRDEPRFAYTAAVMFALILPTLIAYGLDSRTIDATNVWLKPLKFEVSIGVFLITLAFFARYLPPGMLDNRLYRLFSWVVIACAVIEMLWILSASAYGVRSHFNVGPTMSQIYGLMGIVAVVLTSASFVYGAAMLWVKDRSGLVTSIAFGSMLTFVLTVITASRLASNGGHFVGVPVSDAALPILGWSLEVGDLRIAHFLATHAMHFVPLAYLALAKLPLGLAGGKVVLPLSLAYIGLTGLTFFVALQGLPLF